MKSARLTLLWPLAIQLPVPPAAKDGAVADAVKACARRLAVEEHGDWTRESDLASHIEQTADEQWIYDVYAEGVYFHDFVRGFLFARQSDNIDEQPLWLFRRRDLERLEVKWGAIDKPKCANFDVKRVNLYLFRSGAAILVVELWRDARGQTLADVEDLHDILRRAYHPFGDKAGISHLVPREITWRAADGSRKDFNTRKDFDDIAGVLKRTDGQGRRLTPIFEHWRHLLSTTLPLEGYEGECKSRDPEEGGWRQVMDERMPTMLTLSLTAEDESKDRLFRAMRRGDFARLCFADGSNSDAAETAVQDDYPYDSEFLANFEARHAYDRFASWGTRFFISGYAFVAVGAGDGIDGFVAMHMRRHYFQMNLIVNLEKATLLSFSSQISDAARRYDEKRDEGRAFREEMREINEAFLQFVHRFRFTGVTNQMQGGEIFDMLRREADVNRLYEDVRGEIESANQYLFNRDQAEAAREASHSAEAANRLGRVAAVGVVAAMVAGLLGMNVLAQPDLFLLPQGVFRAAGADGKLTLAGHVLIFLAASGAILAAGALAVRRIADLDPAKPEDNSLHDLLARVSAWGQWMMVAAALWFVFLPAAFEAFGR